MVAATELIDIGGCTQTTKCRGTCSTQEIRRRSKLENGQSGRRGGQGSKMPRHRNE